MREELLKLIEGFKKDKRILSFDEAAIKQAVVLRILKSLGWDPFNIDEVWPEYSTSGKRIDLVLRHNGYNKVFIEVKKANENLEKHQEQLLSYSFQEGVKLAVLTNGISWWFYLPLREGAWEQRKFYTIEIYEQESSDIALKFENFLSKENVISDRSIEVAENLYKSRQKQQLIKNTLPKAWEKIITEPDEFLVELLAETTERLCGYRPEVETVEEFLSEVWEGKRMWDEKEKEFSARLFSLKRTYSPMGYTGKPVVAFTFRGHRYPVKSWKEMLIKVVEIIYSTHPREFERVLTMKGRKRPYFTRNPNELVRPKRISNTDIYVETNLSANSIVERCKKIIALFGYDE